MLGDHLLVECVVGAAAKPRTVIVSQCLVAVRLHRYI